MHRLAPHSLAEDSAALQIHADYAVSTGRWAEFPGEMG